MSRPITTSPVTQVCWVSEDLAATEQMLSRAFGVTRWTRLPGVRLGPDTTTYRGDPADIVVDISLSYSGDLQLEIVQLVSGASPYQEFLDRCGPGMHHVCFEVDDVDAAVAEAEAQGFAIVLRGSMADGGVDFAYLDGSAWGAPYFELVRIRDDIRPFFDHIKAQSKLQESSE